MHFSHSLTVLKLPTKQELQPSHSQEEASKMIYPLTQPTISDKAWFLLAFVISNINKKQLLYKKHIVVRCAFFMGACGGSRIALSVLVLAHFVRCGLSLPLLAQQESAITKILVY